MWGLHAQLYKAGAALLQAVNGRVEHQHSHLAVPTHALWHLFCTLQVWREQGVEGIQKLLGEGDACRQFKRLMGHCRDGCKAPAGKKGHRVSKCTQLQELEAKGV